MDFRLTEEQKLVRDTARDFVDRELIPHVREWEEKGEVPRSFYRKMASLGFLGAPVPEKYGGARRDDGPVLPPLAGGGRGCCCRPGPGSAPAAPSEDPLLWVGSGAQEKERAPGPTPGAGGAA